MVRSVKKENLTGKNPGILQQPPDLIYAVLVVILSAFGTVMLFSAGAGLSDPFEDLRQHAIHLLLALVLCIFFLLVTTPKSAHWIGPAFYGASVLLLGLVLIVGKATHSAQRWLPILGLTFQPSELAKTAVILLLAMYFSVNPERFRVLPPPDGEKKKWFRTLFSKRGWKSFLRSFWNGVMIPGAIVLVPALLIGLEPHFFGVIILGGMAIVMMLLGGTNLLQLLAVGIPAAGGLWHILRAIPYTNTRLEGLLNRGGNGAADEQTTNGLIAMGSGGWFGVGLGNSGMKYGYVPEPQNDFIFSIICEELGFFGAMLIILLFLALFARGIRLAQKCEDRFSALVIAGISFKIILHAFLNIGVATAFLPNTGISLPFFSSGGSAMLVLGTDMGIVLGLSRFCKYD